jgi:methionine synthase I (cobalamin-dependent)
VSLLRQWLAGGLLITDGAWGTELQARGLEPGASPDHWNLTHPERVEAVARAYVAAGSQVILTNTFRANAIAMEGDLAAINRGGVAISRRAAAGAGTADTGADRAAAGTAAPGTGTGRAGTPGATPDHAAAGTGTGRAGTPGAAPDHAAAGTGTGHAGTTGAAPEHAAAGAGTGHAAAGTGTGHAGTTGAAPDHAAAGTGAGHAGTPGSAGTGCAAASDRAAPPPRVLVFASIGPTGKMLTAGEIGEEQVRAAFDAQAAALAGAGADALLLETMSDIAEARLAVAAAKSTGLPVIVSFAFDSGRNKDRTMMGATPEAVAAAMVEAGADAVGANCGVGVEHAAPICRRLRAACDLPIWIKPNAGLPKMEGTAIRYDTSPELFASYYAALREAGASFLGGCCGSTPDFIRALVNARCASS